MTTNTSTSFDSSSFRGRWRCAVRGFCASKTRSTTRLKAFAPFRAPIRAISPHSITRHDGNPSAAQIIEMIAKGSENNVCENITNSLYNRILVPILRATSMGWSLSFKAFCIKPQHYSAQPLRAIPTSRQINSGKMYRYLVENCRYDRNSGIFYPYIASKVGLFRLSW
ncbi:hypothetical protein D3C74_324710 [compost metagenome]